MTSLRILALTTSYPLRVGDSSGVFIQRLYQALSADWCVEVICPADIGIQDPPSPSGNRVAVRPFRYAPRAWQVLAQGAGGVVAGMRANPLRWLLVPGFLVAMLVASVMRSRRSTLIHANWALCGAAAVIVGRLARRPVVTTLRGDDVARAKPWSIDRLLLWLAVRGSSAVVCVSEAMAKDLKARFPGNAGRIQVCLNGVETRFREVARQPSQRSMLRLITVGSLIHRKGVDVLLRAIAQARSRRRMSLEVVGDGPESKSLRALANSLGIEAQVRFVGSVPPGSVPDHLSASDLLILASRSEGRPNVILEALAAGLPVVCSDLPGVAGLVQPGSNGDVFPIGDSAALAQVLDRVVDQPGMVDRWSLAAKAQGRSCTCSWADTSECYRSVFRQALATRGSRG